VATRNVLAPDGLVVPLSGAEYRLRKRLRDDSREPELIKTVRGEGYVLAAAVEAEA